MVGLALLWVYVRRHDHFYRFRNWILLANVFGLVGYVFLPTAPPRMFPSFGFLGALRARRPQPRHGFVSSPAANPYAAMPSLHAADALIVGVSSHSSAPMVVKPLWRLWPPGCGSR